MIAVKLQGGLGNQMFQYAAARVIGGNKGPVYFDTTFLKTQNISSDQFTARRYELHIFSNLKVKIAGRLLLKILLEENKGYKVMRKIFFRGFTKLVQAENDLIKDWGAVKQPVYLDGYFQSEKYFRSIRNNLLSEFSFPEIAAGDTALAKIQSDHHSVAIHVRRGDYLKADLKNYHGILPLSYYKKAIQEINNKVRDPFYYIFSDDTEWCRLNFQFLQDRWLIIDKSNPGEAWKDLFLMTQCRHHIIANSSYSWWGAWLSVRENGCNIAPQNWFNPALVKFNIQDIIPASWYVIHYD